MSKNAPTAPLSEILRPKAVAESAATAPTATVLDRTDRIASIEVLRAVAALAVVAFHFLGTNGMPTFWRHPTVDHAVRLGRMGVQVFFVISGFVLPYALARGGYQLRHFFRFFAKRIVRLEPPYLLSLVITWQIWSFQSFAPPIWMPRQELTLPVFGWHIGYLIPLTKYLWINPVYWTLAVEVQFYLLIGLTFPLLAAGRRTSTMRLAAIVAICALGTAVYVPHVPVAHWFSVFGLGILAFLWRSGSLDRERALAAMITLAAVVSIKESIAMAIISLATAIVIVHWNGFKNRWLATIGAYLGRISYSVYLIHFPVGVTFLSSIVDWGWSGHGEAYALLAPAFLALLFTLFWASLLWLCVELPAQHWAAKIRYRPHMATVPIGDVAPVP